MRLQSAQLTEISLASKNDAETGCLLRLLCTNGIHYTGSDSIFPEISLGRGIEDFRLMLEAMADDVSRWKRYETGLFRRRRSATVS
jgi:hypothetical protein